jgi:hypothetical protein
MAGPMIISNRVTTDHAALDVHPSQVVEANRVSREICGRELFRPDGRMEASRSQKKEYMKGINDRRQDGEARIVNRDGGYGDET